MPATAEQLEDEGARATELLAGRVVVRVVRHTNGIMLEFEGGARLFVDSSTADVELSITGTQK